MKIKNLRNITGASAIIFYAVCGLLLLLWPNLALSIANYALAAVLCVGGICLIVIYFRHSAAEGALGFNLALGLLLLLVGAVLCINSGLLMALLPFLWGVAMIAGGFGKVQMAFDLKRMRQSHWWLLLLGATISLVLGVLSVTRPEFIATIATQFMGISLLVEAVLDLGALIALKKQLKSLVPEGESKVE